MRWVIASSLRYRFIVVAAAIGLMVFGAGQLKDARTDAFPEFAPPRVEVQTITLGLSPEETEEFVTVPMEQTMNGVAGLDTIRSTTVAQLSSVEMIFKQGTNLIRARQAVQERLNLITPSLPTWAAPPVMRPPLSAVARIMQIGVTADKMPMTELSTIAYWKIRARLLRVPGVVNVAIWGERLQQQHVDVEPARMQANNVTLDEVMNTTADSLDAGLLKYNDYGNTIGTGGFVDNANQRLGIRSQLPIKTMHDLSKVAIKQRDGKAIRIGDVAKVGEGHQPLIGDAVVNGGPGLLLVVERAPGANTLKVTHGIDNAIRDLQPGLPGVHFDTKVFRQADFVEIAVDNLKIALLLGILLVILILIAFLFEWRTALISLVAIPLSLMAALMVLYLRGDTINTMILAGLAIAVGVVVDDAIIDVENIWRRLRQRGDGTGRLAPRIILDASLEVRSAILYATLINVLAVVPVFFLQSVTGSFFQPLALSYALAILVSMVVALTVTPALALLLLAKTRDRRDAPVVRWLKRNYEAALARVIHRPLPAVGVVVVLALLGVTVGNGLGHNLYPEFKERDFFADWATPPGTSSPEENRITTRFAKDIEKIPGVRSFGAHEGQAFLAEEVVGQNFGEGWFSIDRNANYDKTVDALRETVDGYPGMYRELLTYLRERIDEVLAASTEPIVVRIFGQNVDTLRAQANRVENALSEVKGLEDLNTELYANVPQVDVRENLAAGSRYGLKPGDVRRAAGVMLASEEVGDIFRGARAYDVHVWSTPQTRRSLTDIRNLPIDTPSGSTVRLANVADVRVRPALNIIKRENNERRIDVRAGVSGRSLSAVVGDVKSNLKKVDLPPGYRAEVLGEAEETTKAQHRLLIFGIAAAIGIFLLLQAAFGSLRIAALFFLTLPMALVGGILAASLFSNGVLSLGSFVGFLAVFGIAARNGILLINHCQHLERHEGEAFGPALVIRGARERLSPILMTALATGLALIPLIVGGPAPGKEIEHPMAIVILGGLITSTLVNLFIVPTLYLRFGKSRASRVTPA
ncbi:MAG: acriflavin resistance protein [Candidatus Rokuibacteriota bacterium]|nr:MAG: acriflavin resistance protein [Candidatus Rokubacteria bacterium]